jgi:hypothetical protein
MLVAVIPNYEAFFYAKTEPVNGTSGYLGYPAGDIVEVLRSAEGMEKEVHVFTVEVDAQNLKSLGVYHGLGAFTKVTDHGIFHFVSRFNTDQTYGQFYLVELENGDQVVILLDDIVLKLPKTGKVRLPRGKVEKLGETSKKYLSEKLGVPQESLKYYVDAARNWRSHEGKKSEQVRAILSMVCLVGGFLLGYLLLVLLRKKYASTQEANPIAEAGAEENQPNFERSWFKLEEIKEDGYKPTARERAEIARDNMSKGMPYQYDWRKDTKRSWSRIGDFVFFWGIALVILTILFLIFVFKGMDVFAIGIPVGILLAFVGAKISKWDQPEKLCLSRIDSNLVYQFTLALQGREESIQDFEKVEEAYHGFVEDHEAFTLTIVPPIGGLSEWECHYDEKYGYVTDIILSKERKVQKWRKSSGKPCPRDCDNLRKIMTLKEIVTL